MRLGLSEKKTKKKHRRYLVKVLWKVGVVSSLCQLLKRLQQLGAPDRPDGTGGDRETSGL